MRNKILLVIFLILVFSGFTTFRFLIMDRQNNFGRIKVVSSPSASVFIDNQIVGSTPFEDKFKTGEFLIKLIPQGTATDTASWQGKITVYKNALTYVNQELGASDISTAGEIFTTTPMDKRPSIPNTGQIYVETEPNGSIVYLDNDEKGVSPLILDEVPKGDHEISVFMPGFFRRTQKINVDTAYKVNASFKLAIDDAQKPASKPTITTSKDATSSASTNLKNTVVINDTPTGFLRVREEPSTNASESAQVKPGTKFTVIEEDSGWYKIEYEKGKEGWISGQYATKQ